MLRTLKYANRILLIFAISITSLAVLYVLLRITFSEENKIVIYPLIFKPSIYEDLLLLSGVSLLTILIAFILIAVLYGWFAKQKPDMRTGAKAIYLIFFATGLMCIAPFAFVFSPFGSPFGYREVLTTTQFGGATYRLTTYSPDPFEGSFHYYLYQCDQFDLFCTNIYDEYQFSVGLKVGNLGPGSEQLLPDPTTNTLTLLINGEAVYTHTP
jgi:hypothetical protein